MNKIKLLTYSVFALLLVNIISLVFVIQSNKRNDWRHPNERPRPDQIIIKKLHFDEQQKEDYQKLIHWHRSKINGFDAQIRETKQELYLQLLKSNTDERVKDSLVNNLTDFQKQIEMTHFKHFQDIKNICRPNQMQDFNELTEELALIFNRGPKPKN